MLLWSQLPSWTMRAWPFWALLPGIAVHLLALAYVPCSVESINKAAAALLQVVGGIIVIYSIDENLGVFRQKSLWKAVVDWLRSFPIKRPPTIIRGSVGVATGSSSAAAIGIVKGATTIEERVAELERRLLELVNRQREDTTRLANQIQNHRKELNERISSTSERLNQLDKRLDQSVVGGFKLQCFGVSLMIHGAITSVFA